MENLDTSRATALKEVVVVTTENVTPVEDQAIFHEIAQVPIEAATVTTKQTTDSWSHRLRTSKPLMSRSHKTLHVLSLSLSLSLNV